MTSIAREAAAVIALLCAITPIPNDVTVKLMHRSTAMRTDPRTGASLTGALTPENHPGIRAAIIDFDGLTRETGAKMYKWVTEARAMVTFTANMPPSTVLPAPVVTARGTSTSEIRGEWNIVPGAWAFLVEQCVGASCTNFSQVACLEAFDTTHTGLAPGTTVRYRVRSSRDRVCSTTAGNLSAYSAIVSGTTLSTTPTPKPTPKPTGQGTLPWLAPTNNTDGSPLTDLAGFRVVWGQDPNALTNSRRVPPDVRSYTVTGLTPGTWYFAVKAYTTRGQESDLSTVRSKVIQ